MKYCSKKHTNPDDAVFCNECGEKLGIQTTEKTKKCPNCSADNPADAEFCHHCGTSLTVKKPETNQSLKKEEQKMEIHTKVSTSNDNDYIGFLIVAGIFIFVGWMMFEAYYPIFKLIGAIIHWIFE